MTQFRTGRPKILSQESKSIIASASGIGDSSSRKVSREMLGKEGEHVSGGTARRKHQRQGLKPFHVITKPLKTNAHIDDQKWLAEYVVQGISLIA